MLTEIQGLTSSRVSPETRTQLLHRMDRPDHFERRARITNQVFRAMKSAT
jgi:hypothetical protein